MHISATSVAAAQARTAAAAAAAAASNVAADVAGIGNNRMGGSWATDTQAPTQAKGG